MWEITGQLLGSAAHIFGSVLGSAGAIVVGGFAIVFGLVSVLFGRRLYGPISIVFGMAAGVLIATGPLPGLSEIQPAWLQIFAIVAAGIIGTVVVAVLWRLAPMFAGAGAAALFGYMLLQGTGLSLLPQLAVLAVFAVAGAVLVSLLMDWGLILGSSLASALMAGAYVTSALQMGDAFGWLVFAALASAGIWHQSRHLQQQRQDRILVLPDEPAVSN